MPAVAWRSGVGGHYAIEGPITLAPSGESDAHDHCATGGLGMWMGVELGEKYVRVCAKKISTVFACLF